MVNQREVYELLLTVFGEIYGDVDGNWALLLSELFSKQNKHVVRLTDDELFLNCERKQLTYFSCISLDSELSKKEIYKVRPGIFNLSDVDPYVRLPF